MAFPGVRPMMSVNLSARQFAQADLGQQISEILAATGLPPASLELEITESVVMDSSTRRSMPCAHCRRWG